AACPSGRALVRGRSAYIETTYREPCTCNEPKRRSHLTERDRSHRQTDDEDHELSCHERARDVPKVAVYPERGSDGHGYQPDQKSGQGNQPEEPCLLELADVRVVDRRCKVDLASLDDRREGGLRGRIEARADETPNAVASDPFREIDANLDDESLLRSLRPD